MKTTLFLFLLTFSFFAEARTIDDIANQKEIKRLKYSLTSGLMETIVINMSYGQSVIINSTDIRKLKNADILEVHLVFTDFPKGIDLKNLNRSRIGKAMELRKDLVTDETIPWKLFRQMSCKNESEANVLFHGIVIFYRSEQSKEVLKKDLDYISSTLPEEPKTVDDTKKIIKSLPDSSVLKILGRNKKWNNMTVVTDVTGSMSPYLTQVMLWFKLHESDNGIKNVVVFNDGDTKSSKDKIVGRVEGIYSGSPKSFVEVKDLMINAMMNGSGGDWQENDIEALLVAQNKFEKSNEFILIADNLAPVRDMELIKNLKKPVRIVLCGTRFGINPQYLTLARETGGSVHTLENDLTDLAKRKEGEIVVIGRQSFKIVGGTFIRLSSL